MTLRQITCGLLTAGMIVVVASGCSDDPEQEPSASSIASQSSHQSPPATAAEQAVLAVYRGFQDATVAAYANPTADHSELDDFAADKALAAVEGTVIDYRTDGVQVRGTPTIDPHVSSIDEQANPPQATILDCFDDSNWVPVDAATGDSVAAPGQNSRYSVTAKLAKIDDRWFVVELTPDRSRRC